MPDLVDVDLEQRVAQLVEAHRPQLAELVRRAVDLELERLVDVELADRNGNGLKPSRDARVTQGADSRAMEPSAAVVRDPVRVRDLEEEQLRRCRHCNESKPLDQFGPHRHVCRRCRADQQARARERRAAG